MILNAKAYDTGDAVAIALANGHIRSIEPAPAAGSESANWPWVAPAFLDIQVNGRGGQNFSSTDLTPKKVDEVLTAHYAFGLTRLCPTLVTSRFEALAAGMGAIRAACEASKESDRLVPAIHLEGPYISAEDGPRGAHPLGHVRPPDWDEFSRLQDAAGGRIGLVTLAPELPGAIDFITRLARSGVTVAIGHTAASPEQIDAAVDAGATLSTHLGNGAHRELRRHPNYIWEQLAADGLSASIICDGHHLPAAVVKTFVRAKTPARIVLVSDAAGLAGLPPGRYRDEMSEVEIMPDGRIVIAGQDQLLAGSTCSVDTCVANVMHFAGVSLREAVDMAGRNPARLLGLPEHSIRAGEPADLVLFRLEGTPPAMRVVATIAAGELRHGAVPKF